MLLCQQVSRHVGVAAKLVCPISPSRAALAVSVSSSPELRKCWFTSSAADQTDSPPHLSVEDLHQAAKLARLSGLCYGTPETLAARLQAEGLQVLAQGQTSFTRYSEHRHPIVVDIRAIHPFLIRVICS